LTDNVFLLGIRVDGTVHFNNKVGFTTVKVHYELSNGVLPPELDPKYLPITQVVP